MMCPTISITSSLGIGEKRSGEEGRGWVRLEWVNQGGMTAFPFGFHCLGPFSFGCWCALVLPFSYLWETVFVH